MLSAMRQCLDLMKEDQVHVHVHSTNQISLFVLLL